MKSVFLVDTSPCILHTCTLQAKQHPVKVAWLFFSLDLAGNSSPATFTQRAGGAFGAQDGGQRAAQAADLSRAQILEMLFPMKAHTDYRERLRSGILQPVCAALDEGKLVAMVTLGDVSVYSTASYVRQLLEEKGYETRVAAGVPSFCAGAAKAKQSLCENGKTLGILPGVASREVLEQAFDEFDNLVIMKAGRALSWLLPLLEERGLLEHTTMLRDVGMASEYVGSPQAEPYSYFTTLLIRQRGE